MSVLTLADAKSRLNITVATYDAELQDTIDDAEAAIAEKCGDLELVQKTERVRGGGLGLVLTHTPVASLVSVTPVNGTAIDLDLLDLHSSSGVVEWGSGAIFSVGRYDVVYNSGRATVPNDLLRAVKEQVAHMWMTQRGRVGTGSPRSTETANTMPGAAYQYPWRVEQLMMPHVQVGN